MFNRIGGEGLFLVFGGIIGIGVYVFLFWVRIFRLVCFLRWKRRVMEL